MICERGELSLVFAVQVLFPAAAPGTRPSQPPAEALLLRLSIGPALRCLLS